MIVYTVQKGDSLWNIARRHQISLDALLAANPQVSDPNYILTGQQINIPELWQPVEPPSANTGCSWSCPDDDTRPFIYLSQEGDTLEKIGSLFMVPLSLLLYYNLKYEKKETLPTGTRIIIPETGGQTTYPNAAQPTLAQAGMMRRPGHPGWR